MYYHKFRNKCGFNVDIHVNMHNHFLYNASAGRLLTFFFGFTSETKNMMMTMMVLGEFIW